MRTLRWSRSRAALCGVLLFVAAAPAHAATRFLVAVGARTGLAHEDPLAFADADARRFRDAFVDLGAVADARATLVDDGDAQALELELARLQGQVEEAVRQGERVEVIFYASSHGDAEALHLSGARYPLATLRDRLQRIPADATLVVLDACRTAAVDRTADKGAVRGPAFDVTVQRELAPRGTVTLYAARAGEAAQESDTLEGAYFTHHFVVGLRGAADFDGDKKVTLAEAWRHAHATTLARSHATARAQHPEMEQALEGEAELVLVDLSRARATLALPAALAGNLLLFDATSGRVLLEIDKAKGRALDVALPARKVRVQLRPADARDTARIGEIDLSWGGVRTLDASALDEQPLLAAVDKGGAADPTPWIVNIGAGVGASSLARLEWGADAWLARRVLELPLFVRARVGASRSDVDATQAGATWRYVHLGARAGVGVEAELWLADAARVAAGLEVGALGVRQQGARTDAARVEALGLEAPVVDAWGAGPYGALDGSIAIPIVGGLAFTVAAQLGAGALPQGGALTPLPFVIARAGLALEW